MSKTITRPLLALLRDDINAALKAVAEKHGLAISTGKCTFSDLSCSFKLECAVIPEGGSSGEKASHIKAAADLKTYAKLFDADSAWAGKVFSTGRGSDFTIRGLLPNRDKNCILATRNSTGKDFIFPVEEIKRYLGHVAA